MNTPAVITKRPAESTALAGAVALLCARLLGLSDPDVIVSLSIVIGFIPFGITWLVETLRGRAG